MTVLQFANKCMKDSEFLRGGIVKNERKCLDEIGFSYKVEGGQITESGEDLAKFYEAVNTLVWLNRKYSKEA